MILKQYQVDAIDELVHDSAGLLNTGSQKTLVFKSPTGSGKTIIMAELIKQLSESKVLDAPFSVIWAAPRKLHSQSKNKLEKYYEASRAVNCVFFEDLDDRSIDENEILFFNWESINKKNAIYIKENETENNLSTVIERTRDNGNKIILVIDESHFAAGTGDTKSLSAAMKLREDIAPDLTIEVSATPKITGDKTVSVTIDEVKLESMIKKSVIVNPEYKNVFKGNELYTELPGSEKNSDELLLTSALEKRVELENKYIKEGLKIRPLLLIQLPDKKSGKDVDIRQKVEDILSKNNITESNGKLKIYLSEEKSDGLSLVSKDDDETDVLIFKQGIALGWDCPRAQILVLFREWKSLTFSIQTIGRIMRMPDPTSGYYKDELLNHAYVFTNFEHITVQEDLASGYVTINTSRRQPSYKEIKLPSVYSKRQREKTRLNPTFIQIFLNEAKKYKLADKLNIHNQRVSSSLIKNYESLSVDEMSYTNIKGSVSIKVDNEDDLQKLFDQFAYNSLEPEFYPSPESVARVKESIYYFFSTALGIFYNKKFKEVINIAISDENKDKIISVINNAKKVYLDGVLTKEAEFIEMPDWQIPEVFSTAQNLLPTKKIKSIMQPFLSDQKWKSETAFIIYLERNNNVEWWFKNGVGDSMYFALPYDFESERKLFWVDFIIKFTDGKIGLFDPHGKQFKDLEYKAIGLEQYVNNDKNLRGGIISNTDQNGYNGAWQIYSVKDKSWNNLEL